MSLNISNLSLKESYNLTGGFTPAQCEMILDWIAKVDSVKDDVGCFDVPSIDYVENSFKNVDCTIDDLVDDLRDFEPFIVDLIADEEIQKQLVGRLDSILVDLIKGALAKDMRELAKDIRQHDEALCCAESSIHEFQYVLEDMPC